jgi:predicted Holliday junction resolvase-like endonuclease
LTNLQSCSHKSKYVHTSINEIQTGQKINCEAIQVILGSIVHITKAISQLREDVEKKQVNNQTENYSNPIQELLQNHNTNEIINEANETNISEVSNSNGKNETSTNIIDDAVASNTPNLSERLAPHLNDPNGKYRQNDPTPKHLVPCPFLRKK